jgi:hypothetical protein
MISFFFSFAVGVVVHDLTRGRLALIIEPLDLWSEKLARSSKRFDFDSIFLYLHNIVMFSLNNDSVLGVPLDGDRTSFVSCVWSIWSKSVSELAKMICAEQWLVLSLYSLSDTCALSASTSRTLVSLQVSVSLPSSSSLSSHAFCYLRDLECK